MLSCCHDVVVDAGPSNVLNDAVSVSALESLLHLLQAVHTGRAYTDTHTYEYYTPAQGSEHDHTRASAFDEEDTDVTKERKVLSTYLIDISLPGSLSRFHFR